MVSRIICTTSVLSDDRLFPRKRSRAFALVREFNISLILSGLVRITLEINLSLLS